MTKRELIEALEACECSDETEVLVVETRCREVIGVIHPTLSLIDCLLDGNLSLLIAEKQEEA